MKIRTCSSAKQRRCAFSDAAATKLERPTTARREVNRPTLQCAGTRSKRIGWLQDWIVVSLDAADLIAFSNFYLRPADGRCLTLASATLGVAMGKAWSLVQLHSDDRVYQHGAIGNDSSCRRGKRRAPARCNDGDRQDYSCCLRGTQARP